MTQTKKWMLAAIFTLCGTMNSFAQQQQPQDLKGVPGIWTLMAKLENPEDTLLIIATDNMKDVKEVVKDQNGMFLFTTNLTEAKIYFIYTRSLVRHTGGFSLMVDAVPGEVLSAKGFCERGKPADGLTFEGSKFYEHYTEAYTIQAKVREEEDGQPAIDFVKAHPGDEVAATLVGTVGCHAPNRLEEMLGLLSPEVRNGRMKTYIEQQVEEAKEYVKQKELEGKTLKMGRMAPDFTLNDLNGQPLTLSSLRGKFLVLDFWGSWCTWCIKGFPAMKKYYEKYKDKMEILGMDCNDTEAKWKKAVADNELPWKQVFVPKGSQVFTDYLISAFPTKIIISPEGNIVTTIVGEDPKFYEMLDEIFQKE